MGIVIFENTISLDGFVAGPNDGHEYPLGEGGMRLFDWYSRGNTLLQMPGTPMEFKVSRSSAEFLEQAWSKIGAGVIGRRTFNIANAWGGKPPGGGNSIIMTHNPPQEWIYEGSPFIFVTEGIEEAVRQAKTLAGAKDVSIGSANIAQQCLKAGLLDEIILDIVPVLLGAGRRLFDNLGAKPIELESIKTVEGDGVMHQHYRIIK